jgi:hypothetical protein
MEEITEWPTDLLIPVNQEEFSDPDLIEIPVVTREEYDAPNNSRRIEKEEVQEMNSVSEETASDSPGGGGDDEVEKKRTKEKKTSRNKAK